MSRYLLLKEDGSMSVTDHITDELIAEYDAGILEVVDMQAKQYLKAIAVGGFQWEFIDKE